MSKKFCGIPAADWYWILALGVARFLISLRYGLGVDEAHYVLYGLRLDWSYFDHPPLIGWVQGLFLFLFGRHDVVAHLSAEICGVITTVLAFRLCLRLGDERRARWGALALNASFLVNGVWLMLVPDTLLLILAYWLIDIVMALQTEQGGHRLRWLELGVCVGLCGLAKYTAVILLPSLVGYLILQKAWGVIRPFGLLLAVVTAALVVSPVFYWNYHHDWLSFKYQFGHVLGAKDLALSQMAKNLGGFVAVQLAAFSPFVIGAAAVGWWRARCSLQPAEKLVLWIALPALLFFAYSSLTDQGLPHWTLLVWGLLIPVGVVHVARPQIPVLISLGVLLVLFTELAFHIGRFPPYQSPYKDFAGWHELHDDLKTLLEQEAARSPDHQLAIGVTNWTLGSRANYYFADLKPVYVLDTRFDQFDLWEGGPPIGRDLLVTEWRGFGMDSAVAARCGHIDEIGERTYSEHDRPVTSVKLFWCRAFKSD